MATIERYSVIYANRKWYLMDNQTGESIRSVVGSYSDSKTEMVLIKEAEKLNDSAERLIIE